MLKWFLMVPPKVGFAHEQWDMELVGVPLLHWCQHDPLRIETIRMVDAHYKQKIVSKVVLQQFESQQQMNINMWLQI